MMRQVALWTIVMVLLGLLFSVSMTACNNSATDRNNSEAKLALAEARADFIRMEASNNRLATLGVITVVSLVGFLAAAAFFGVIVLVIALADKRMAQERWYTQMQAEIERQRIDTYYLPGANGRLREVHHQKLPSGVRR